MPRSSGLAPALVVLAAGGWFAWQTVNVRWARTQVAQVAALAEERHYAGAFDLAVAVEHVPAG